MEASCFFTSKFFSKTLDLLVPRTQSSIFNRKRFSQCPNGFGTGPSSFAVTSCSLRSQSSHDDDPAPGPEPDWRSFRARLVAGEQSPGPAAIPAKPLSPSSSTTTVLLTDKWAHPLYEPEKGCLLIATEKLDGVHIFERTVILLLSSGPSGPAGVILNRPSLMSIKETRSTDFDSSGTFSDRPLFFGGPLEGGVFLVQGAAAGSGVFEEVMKGVYYGGKESVGCAAEMVKRSVVSAGEFRFFDGYCGWEEEQLKEEIRSGYWTVAACSPGVVAVDCVELWEEVLGLVGERKVW